MLTKKWTEEVNVYNLEVAQFSKLRQNIAFPHNDPVSSLLLIRFTIIDDRLILLNPFQNKNWWSGKLYK